MKRLPATPLLYSILLFLLVATVANAKLKTHLSKVGLGYSQTSVNTAVFRNNSVVTHGRYQFVSYYDADGWLTLAKRRLGKDKWEIRRSQYKGNVKDGHNVISMMVDGDGYLHVSFDHHGNRLRYCRSVAPLSLQLGDLESMVGLDENDVTYPEFYTLRGGDLLFAYRSGKSGRGNLVLNRYNLKERRWQRVQDVLIDGENQRNAYWQLYVDAQGVIHLSWVWRESWLVETNHDLCYARSYDNGRTWQKTTGETYQLPITKANAEYACLIPQNSELINQTSMIADANCNPYIATYWRDRGDSVPQYRLVWFDGQQWQNTTVGHRSSPFSLKGGGTKMIPISRPRMVVDGKKVYYIFRDAERDSRVSMAYSTDVTSGQWTVTDLTDFPVEAWEPSHDTELWKRKHKLHLFVQHTKQGDGERTVNFAAQPIYVLELTGKP